MVSTRQANKSRKSVRGNSSHAGSDDEYEKRTSTGGASKTCGTKRARTDKGSAKGRGAAKRRKKAKLSMLPEMPIDILYEIFSLVHPRDLLHISWTSKVLNRFLTSKSSRHVWQASFKTVPEEEHPPPCPSEMTEMAYTNLVYGRYCMNCAGEHPIQAWASLTKICGSCVEEIATDVLGTRPDHWTCLYDMREMLPTFRVRYPRRGVVVEKTLRSDSKRFIEEYEATEEGLREALIEEYKSLTHKRAEFSRAMLGLERLAEKAREDARAGIQQRRIDRIWEKLAEEGWREEIATRKSVYERGLLEIKGVKMNRPLGEKAWAELRPSLNEFMRKKSERIHNESTADQCESRVKEIEEIVDSFRSTLPHPHDFSPSTTDICWIPKMRKALINGTDQEFQNRKANIQATISELSATLLEERREFFLRLLPQDSPTIEHLSLATTLFDCTACHKYGVRIESALRHRCCYGYNHGWYSEKQFPNAMVAEVFRSEVGPSWSLAKFRYSTELAAIVREVVLECGEDPDIITTREMNRKGHRFACFGTDGKITVFSWLQAFKHKKSQHHAHLPYRALRSDELPEYVPEPEDKRDWGCLHCWGTRSGEPEWECRDFSDIREHLALSHQIENPTEEDYYLDSKPNYTAPIRYQPAKGV